MDLGMMGVNEGAEPESATIMSFSMKDFAADYEEWLEAVQGL